MSKTYKPNELVTVSLTIPELAHRALKSALETKGGSVEADLYEYLDKVFNGKVPSNIRGFIQCKPSDHYHQSKEAPAPATATPKKQPPGAPGGPVISSPHSATGSGSYGGLGFQNKQGESQP